MVVALALNAHHILGGAWNGWAKPVATADDFADFIARWSINDPHGTWGEARETPDGLRYEDTEGSDPETFPKIAVSEDGRALYDLTGWVWVPIQQ
jgi:hypothetical protein